MSLITFIALEKCEKECNIITRPSFQEETGYKIAWVFPSSSNRPLLFKAHVCIGEISRDRFQANSLAERQNPLDMSGRLSCQSVALTLWFCCLYERSTIILAEMFSDMCCLEDNASWNCQSETNTVARSV